MCASKYISFVTGDADEVTFQVIFGNNLIHMGTAEKLQMVFARRGLMARPVNAGYVRWNGERYHTYGASESMNLPSIPEDGVQLTKDFKEHGFHFIAEVKDRFTNKPTLSMHRLGILIPRNVIPDPQKQCKDSTCYGLYEDDPEKGLIVISHAGVSADKVCHNTLLDVRNAGY